MIFVVNHSSFADVVMQPQPSPNPKSSSNLDSKVVLGRFMPFELKYLSMGAMKSVSVHP